jgi:hypothetical protein
VEVCAEAGWAVEWELAVEGVDAVCEAAQSRAARGVGSADAVVVDVDHHVAVALGDAD